MAQLGDRLVNSIDISLINRLANSLGNSVDNSLDNSVDNSLINRLVNRLAKIPTSDRVAKTTATGVELRLSLIQQMGDTRREVTDAADKGTKATAQKQSSLSHSSPSGNMRQTSMYRLKKRPKENSTCTLT